ncbi:MAG: hypothetical protein U5K69_21210 [Balneolaceae bacterium]|nr:hypothetical protein [Balneolaceae bacterium]
MVHIPEGGELTENQKDIYLGQREYLVPVFNRGQTLNITYLNTPKSKNNPSIWLSVQKKGVKVKFSVPYNQILGVSQSRAVLAGIIIGIISLIPTVIYTSISWIAVVIAFLYGLFVQIPGALTIKALKKIREIIGG